MDPEFRDSSGVAYLLAFRTEVRAALTDDNPLDLRSAHRTGFAFTVINPKIVLKFAAAIDPVYRGAITANPFLQNFADRSMQRFGLFDRYGIGNSQRI